MTTLLNQALVLTLIGMGMTFGALGLLVLGMYAMTALITDKPRRETASTEEAPAEEALVTRVADVVLHLAAAASQPSTEVEADRPRDEDREYAAAAGRRCATTRCYACGPVSRCGGGCGYGSGLRRCCTSEYLHHTGCLELPCPCATVYRER
jgi:sodium pump decarboxylase gamma subunit